jgi:hypothetical protein
VVRATAPRKSIASPHGGAIVAVTVTPDGSAALTVDELGGARLWPALDGSREPLVVDLPEPRDFALGARADGYTAVVLDAAGGLIVTSLDSDGRTRAHATLPAEPAFAGVAMTDAGTLAWRTDQTIALLGDDGAATSQLAAEPGQRIVAVATAGMHAAVVIETAGPNAAKRRARTIQLAPKLAWGAWIGTSSAIGTAIALSPTLNRLASLDHPDGKPVTLLVTDLKSGIVIADMPVGDPTQLEFVDDDHVVVGGPNGVTSIDLGAAQPTPSAVPAPTSGSRPPRPALAAGGGRAMVGFDGELALLRPDKTIEYLGYELESPAVATTAPHGQLLIGLAETYALLDRELAVASAPKLPVPNGSSVSELRWLGGDDWLVSAARSVDGSTSLIVVDLVKGTSRVERSGLDSVPILGYEPTTHHVTLSMGSTPEVDRFDAKSRKLERLAGTKKSSAYLSTVFVPLAPALAGGAQLVRVTMRDRTTIEWFADARALDRPSASAVDDSFAAADAAGHVYMWHDANGRLDLVVYSAGKLVGKLATDGSVALWPDPTGARVAVVGTRGVSLVTFDGKPLWAQDIGGASQGQVAWLDDGALALVTAAGIARLDPATGTVTAARCGWRFGLSNKPHPLTARVEPVCAQLAR